MVKEQAWELFETIQIRIREIMQRHEPGQVLLANSTVIEAAELVRMECDARFGDLAQRLSNFGQSKLENARREWSEHKKGPLAKAQFWALDKVLRLLTLGLTFAVLPPLVWELLRFIGHPSFTNEVTTEFREARAEFRSTMKQAIEGQLSNYGSALDTLGTSDKIAESLRAFVDSVEDHEGEKKS